MSTPERIARILTKSPESFTQATELLYRTDYEGEPLYSMEEGQRLLLSLEVAEAFTDLRLIEPVKGSMRVVLNERAAAAAKEAVYWVEADSFAKDCLLAEYAKKKWPLRSHATGGMQNIGWVRTAKGVLPLVAEVSFVTYRARVIALYWGCSQVVDFELLEEWAKSFGVPHADSFYLVTRHIDGLCREEEKEK